MQISVGLSFIAGQHSLTNLPASRLPAGSSPLAKVEAAVEAPASKTVVEPVAERFGDLCNPVRS